MLSLPTIAPRADATLWPSLRIHSQNPTSFDLESPSSPTDPRRRSSSHGHHAHHHRVHASSRSMLAQLQSEENQIEARKANIRRYGAGWIRPPGVLKTYQALMDEEHEREEQEMLARREQVMMDLAAAQQDAANAEAREEAGDEGEEGERDLDDEVPEAEADESDVSASEESGSEVEEGDTRQDVTFNEDSFIEGSMVEGQVSHMLAMEEASMSGTLQEERDLDDDVPEAGSYEHTDSSLIDSSSEDEVTQASFVQPHRRRSGRRSSGVRRSSGPVLAQQTNRRSVDLDGSSSILEGSSFLRSSPAAARGSLRARFMGARGGRA